MKTNEQIRQDAQSFIHTKQEAIASVAHESIDVQIIESLMLTAFTEGVIQAYKDVIKDFAQPQPSPSDSSDEPEQEEVIEFSGRDQLASISHEEALANEAATLDELSELDAITRQPAGEKTNDNANS